VKQSKDFEPSPGGESPIIYTNCKNKKLARNAKAKQYAPDSSDTFGIINIQGQKNAAGPQVSKSLADGHFNV